MLKSLDWVLYAVFMAVTVRIHSDGPLKERVSVASFQVQSPDFFAVVYLSAAGVETGSVIPVTGVSSWAEEGKVGQLMAEKTPKGVMLKSLDLDFICCLRWP